MALMWRVTARWTGGQIGTGFTNLFFNDGISTPQAAADACRKLLSDALNIGASLPTGVTISFPSAVDVIEPTTGVLVVSTSITAPATITGTATTDYASVAGCCINWVTSGIVAGHRVGGRTFLVPLASAAFDNDGTMDTSFLANLATATATFIAAAPEFVVWHRPASVAAGGGSTHVVLAAKVNDRPSILTSRR